ncbi:MAG: hypothetical protein U0974_13010 [Gemmatimonadales bacterium]|nr:hypothetical protein [Gemmatimonadales bacterium]MDZ4390638.1 hypothetical protein [Gemmatimonadales bacterium]
MIKTLSRSVAYNLAEGGISQIGRKVLARIRSWIFSDDVWLIYRLSTFGQCESRSGLLEQRSMSFADLQRWGYFKALAFPEAIKARLQRGTVCHGFFVDDDLVHINWTTHEYLEIDTTLMVSAPGGVGSFDTYTIPRHRRKGYQSTALMTLQPLLAAQGKTHILTAIEADHAISIKGISNGGGQFVGSITRRVRLGKISIIIEGDGLVLYDR